MKRYEYLAYSTDEEYTEFREWENNQGLRCMQSTMPHLTGLINKLGNEGWLLTSRHEISKTKQEFIFARELEPEQEKAPAVEV